MLFTTVRVRFCSRIKYYHYKHLQRLYHSRQRRSTVQEYLPSVQSHPNIISSGILYLSNYFNINIRRKNIIKFINCFNLVTTTTNKNCKLLCNSWIGLRSIRQNLCTVSRKAFMFKNGNYFK